MVATQRHQHQSVYQDFLFRSVCVCVSRRRQTKVRRKTRYTILDNMDDQERVELRPKFSKSPFRWSTYADPVLA